jgi:hypothetical protein
MTIKELPRLESWSAVQCTFLNTDLLVWPNDFSLIKLKSWTGGDKPLESFPWWGQRWWPCGRWSASSRPGRSWQRHSEFIITKRFSLCHRQKGQNKLKCFSLTSLTGSIKPWVYKSGAPSRFLALIANIKQGWKDSGASVEGKAHCLKTPNVHKNDVIQLWKMTSPEGATRPKKPIYL